MSPEDGPSRAGALLVFTLCVAALTLVLWIEWASTRDRELFTSASYSLMAADTDVASDHSPGR